MTTTDLAGKTIILSGGSRGIGLAIAKRAAADGANVALLAKTAEPHPKLHGTIYTAAEEVEAAGGKALPIVCDVRDDTVVAAAVEEAVAHFGGIDICINNASAIELATTPELSMKKYDLMQDINTRGTFVLSQTCLPYLRRAANPHILTMSPPLNLRPYWAGRHLGYTIAKYGMSLCTLGLAEELRADGIAANSLWPATTIATDAIRNRLGGDDGLALSRTTAIMSDAAHTILTRDSRSCTGNFFIDEEVVRAEGVTDMEQYRAVPGDAPLKVDLFLD